GPAGFKRTRKSMWTRLNEHTVDLINFDRQGSTYGAPYNASVGIRVSFGIRILNDDFPSVALNGPMSDDLHYRLERYHLRFNAETWSTYDRCMTDLIRFLIDRKSVV